MAAQPTETVAEPPASMQPEENGGQDALPKDKKNKRERKEERQKKGKKKSGEENGVTAEQQREAGGADGTGKKRKKQKKRKWNEDEILVGNGEGQTVNGHTLEGETVTKKAKKSKKGHPEGRKFTVPFFVFSVTFWLN